MKSRTIKLLLISTFICSLFEFGCKRKYEDGPLISLTSKCKRLSRGWHLDYFQIDGIDSLNAVYESLGITDNRLIVNLNESSTGSCNDIGPTDVRFQSSKYSGQLEGNYYLSKDDKYLNMILIDAKKYTNVIINPVGPFYTNDYVNYRITRLTKKDLWLESTYNGKTCVIHFKD